MNNIALGKYIPGSSFIHKLDPRNKILIMILLMVTIFWNVGEFLKFPVYLILTLVPSTTLSVLDFSIISACSIIFSNSKILPSTCACSSLAAS